MPGFSAPAFLAVDNAVGDDLTPAEKMGVLTASNGQAVDSVINAQAAAHYKATSNTVDELQKSSVHDQESWWRTATPMQRDAATTLGYKKPLPANSVVAAPEGFWGELRHTVASTVDTAGNELQGAAKAGWQVGQDVQHAVRNYPQWANTAAQNITNASAQGGNLGGAAAIGGNALNVVSSALHGAGDVMHHIPNAGQAGHIAMAVANPFQGEIGRLQRTVGAFTADEPVGNKYVLPDVMHMLDPKAWSLAYQQASDPHYIATPVKAYVMKLFGGNETIYKIALMQASGMTSANIYAALNKQGPQNIPLQPTGASQPVDITQLAYDFGALQADPQFLSGVAALAGGQVDMGRVFAESELYKYDNQGHITGTNFNPTAGGWQSALYHLTSGAMDAGVDWYSNPMIAGGKARDVLMITKYMMRDGQSLREAAMLEPRIMAKIDSWAEDLKPGNLGSAERMHDPRDITVLTEMARAGVQPDRDSVLNYFAEGAGENALLNGHAAHYYKNKLLWPHLTRTNQAGLALKGGFRTVLDWMENGPEHSIDFTDTTPTDTEKALDVVPKDMTAHEAAQPVGSPYSAEDALRNRTFLAPLARLTNKLVNLNIEHPYIDLNLPSATTVISRFARLYLRDDRADQIVEQFARSMDEATRFNIVRGTIEESFIQAGIDRIPGGQKVMRDYLQEFGDRHYSLVPGNDQLDGQAAALEYNQLTSRLPLPDVKKLLELSQKNYIWDKANASLNADLINSFMEQWWKPAMLFRMGFGIRVAGEEYVAAMFRDGFANLLLSRGALSTRDRVAKAIFDQSDPALVSHFYAVHHILPDSEVDSLIKQWKSVIGTHDPKIVERSYFGTLWREWTAKVLRQKMMAHAIITGSRFVPEDMLATAFRLIEDNESRVLGGMTEHASGLGNIAPDGLKNNFLLGDPKNGRSVEFSVGSPQLVTKPVNADDIANNWNLRSEWNGAYGYALNGFRYEAHISRAMIHELAAGKSVEEAEAAGAKFILEEYKNPSSLANAAARSKKMPDGEVVGLGASKEQMAENWAHRRMLDIQHMFYDGEGNPIKMGEDWDPEVKRIASKVGNKRGVKTPVALGPMQNSGRSLLDMIDKGIMPSNDELMSIKAEDMPNSVIARQMVVNEKNWIQGFEERGFYRMVGQPLHYISREPMWLLHVHNGYGDAMARLAHSAPELDDAARSKQAMELAKERADLEISPFIHNPQLRSQFSIMARNISPFWFAQEQQMKRWARTMVMSPELVAKAELTINGLGAVGFLYRNPDTNQLEFNYPGTGYIGQFVAEMMTHGQTPLNMNLSGQVSSLIPGLNRVGVPGTGPLVSIPMDIIQRMVPQFGAFNNAVQGTQATSTSLWEQVVPTLGTRIYEAFSGNDETAGTATFMNTRFEIAAALTAEGLGLKANMTHQQVTDFSVRVTRATESAMFVRAILGFGLPASPSLNIDPLGLNREYTQYLNSGMTYNQALAAFLKAHPAGLPYTVAHSESTSGAYVPETQAVLGVLESNAGVLNKYPGAVPWLLPTKLQSGVFSDTTYQYELATGIRSRTNMTQWADSVIFRMLANNYYYTENYAYNNNLIQEFDQWSANFKNQYPTFNDYLTNSTSHIDRLHAISDMQNLLKDPASLKMQTVAPLATINDLRVMMSSWNTWMQYMVQTKGNSAFNSERWNQTQGFKAWGAAFALKHPDVLSFWNGVLNLEATTTAG
jgi:hypothetical protein